MASSHNPGGRTTTPGPLASRFQNMNLSRQSLGPTDASSKKESMSLAECYEEIGRLRQKIEHKDALVAEANEEKATLNEANNTLHEDVARINVTLRKAENEKRKLAQEIEYLEKERKAQESTIKQLKDQISKAQKTIKVQSDQIAQPNTVVKTRTTPQHPSAPFNQVYSQAPPFYNPSPGNTPSYTGPPTPYPTSLSRQPSTALQTGPPTMSREASFSSFNDGRMSIAPATPQSPFGDGQLAVTGIHEPATVQLMADYTPFFNSVESWCRNYANQPDRSKDSLLPPQLWSAIKQNTNVEIAESLISSTSTRFFAIAKVINQMLVSSAFRPILVKGFTGYFDQRFAEFRMQLQQVAIPMHVRRASLFASASLVIEMTKTKGFRVFLDEVILRQTREMWTFLEPLFIPQIPRNEAWSELVHIWREAARIGIQMMSKASIFSFDFPPVGPNSLFNPSNMVSRDTRRDRDRQAPEFAAVSVRLSITPIVTETDFTGNGVMPRTLHQSNVLLDF